MGGHSDIPIPILGGPRTIRTHGEGSARGIWMVWWPGVGYWVAGVWAVGYWVAEVWAVGSGPGGGGAEEVFCKQQQGGATLPGVTSKYIEAIFFPYSTSLIQ
jgi:hypothetical protein